jgi:transposase
MGEFKEVHIPLGKSRERQEVLRLYRKAQGDLSRTKNRINVKYREHGVKVSGTRVYTKSGRDEYLGQVKSINARFLITALYRKLEGDQQFCDLLQKRLISLVSQNDDFRRLKEIPGVGDAYASIFVCLIDDADRFAGKRKLWKFSGLGLCSRSSGDSGKSRIKGAKSGNRLMKYAALGAAQASLRGDNRFSRHYHKMISEGVDPAMAKRTTARKILATALYMLKNGTEYQDDYDIDN